MEKFVRREVEITENKGFQEAELLNFLQNYPISIDLMAAEDLIFKGADGSITFPSPVSPEDEIEYPELASNAFRRRVALHTTAVGATTFLLLDGLIEAGALSMSDDAFNSAVEVMVLHDLYKIQEIRIRGLLGVDGAYDLAEGQLANLLLGVGYEREDVRLAGSVGHNGARDFFLNVDEEQIWPLTRCAVYMADELLEETVIQPNPFAKVQRLQSDPRYEEINKIGFPEYIHPDHPDFYSKGKVKPKYDVQFEATHYISLRLARELDIEQEEIGKYAIQRAVDAGVYSATFSNPSFTS